MWLVESQQSNRLRISISIPLGKLWKAEGHFGCKDVRKLHRGQGDHNGGRLT